MAAVNDFAVRRRRMVQDQIAARGIRDQRLLAAMKDIPRHLFMDQRPVAAGL